MGYPFILVSVLIHILSLAMIVNTMSLSRSKLVTTVYYWWWNTNHCCVYIFLTRLFNLFCSSSKHDARQGWKEKTLQTNFFWTANFCIGENLWTDEIPCWPRESSTSLLFRNDWKSSQGVYHYLSLFKIFFFTWIHL